MALFTANNQPETMDDLIEEMRELLENEKKEIVFSKFPQDIMHEICLGIVPIYSSELKPFQQSIKEMFGEDLNEREVESFIFNRLYDNAFEWLEEKRKELDNLSVFLKNAIRSS